MADKTPSKPVGETGRVKRALPLSPKPDIYPSRRGGLIQDESPIFLKLKTILSPISPKTELLEQQQQPVVHSTVSRPTTCRRNLLPLLSFQDTVMPAKTGVHLMLTAGLRNPVYANVSQATVSSLQIQDMMNALTTQNSEDIAANIMKIPSILNCIKRSLLQDIDKQCSELCRLSGERRSILRGYHYEQLMERDLYSKCMQELSQNIPFGFDVLSAFVSPSEKSPETSVLPLAHAYSCLMKGRNLHLSRMQNLVSLKLLDAHADRKLNPSNEDQRNVKLLLIFQSLKGVTSSHSQALKQVTDIGQHYDMQIRQKVKEGGSFYFTGDNLDIMIRVRDQRLSTKDQCNHWYVSNIAFDRIDLSHLANDAPKGDPSTMDDKIFFGDSPEDQSLLKKSLRILVGRTLIHHFAAFKWMKPFLPEHIPHRYSSEMSEFSHVYSLPIMFKDEKNYSDCQDILDQCELWLADWYLRAEGKDPTKVAPSEKENILHGVSILYEGDQLTRDRFFHAKLLRGGVRYPSQEFAHIGPFMIALFHNKMDFIHKSYKQLYKPSSTREKGTLKYFRDRLRRTKVSGKVKDNLEAHEELLVLVGKAYLLEAALHYFEMDADDAVPMSGGYPHQPTKMNMHTREKTFVAMLDGFLNFLCDTVSLSDSVLCEDSDCSSAQEKTDVDGEVADFSLNYVKHLLFRFLLLLNINDTCKEADPDRNLVNCKLMTWCALSASSKSKYAIENFNFVLQTQVLLTPQMSEKALTGRWVNLHGKIGENIENDRKQEHSVRTCKRMIRSVHSNKAEAVISKFSKAAQGINDIMENDRASLNMSNRMRKRKKADDSEDMLVVRSAIKELNIFVTVPGRSFPSFPKIQSHPLHSLLNKKDLILKFIRDNKRRLSAGKKARIPPPDSDSDSDE